MILAAGQSRRMGFPKLTLPIDGISMIARAIAACSAFDTVAIVSPYLIEQVAFPGEVQTVVNTEPHLGMSHSLKLADRVIDSSRSLLVIPADKPYLSSDLIARFLALAERSTGNQEADVIFPQRDGVGGHPVLFGPAARTQLAGLPDGDTLQIVRDMPRLRRLIVRLPDDGAYFDVDDPGAIPATPE